MHNIYVKDILKICNAKLITGNEELILSNFSKDTRTIKENDIYVGIRGEKIDGNTFYDEAFKKGASCCILDNIENIDKEKYKNKTIVLVEDTILCLQKLATYKRNLYDNLEVIAVTGSVGKTSTKDIIYEVVSSKYKTLKTEGNENNHIGLPLTILRLKDEEVLVVEMGMNHFKELSVLTNIAKPTIAVITNIGTAHIGNLGSRENILKAKLEILEGLSINGLLITNNDNDMLHAKLNDLQNKYNVKTIGINNKSDINATDIKEYPFSNEFKIDNQEYKINVGGIHHIYNSLIAYTIGLYLNINKEEIKKSLEKFKLSPHRLEKIINKKGTTIIDDTYNANVDSMISAINVLGQIQDKRKIALLADMLELGEYTEELHRKVGSEVAKNNIDILITVGEFSLKYIKDEAIKNNFKKEKIYSFKKYDETYDLLNELLTNKDIILLKGSNAMNLSKIVEKIK